MLSSLLRSVRPHARDQVQPLAGDWPAVTLFLSLSDTHTRAHVLHASGTEFDSVWVDLARQAQTLVTREKLALRWLRLDWVTDVKRSSMQEFKTSLRLVKRNYFRYGLALDQAFDVAFLEGELNGNA